MLKLPVWKNLWLWLWVATLANTLMYSMFPYPIATGTFGGIVCVVMFIIWDIITHNDRLKIKAEKIRLANIKEQVKIFNNLTGRRINPIGLKNVFDFCITYYTETSKKSDSRDIEEYKVLGLSDVSRVCFVQIICEAHEWDSVNQNKTKTETICGLGYRSGETKYWELQNQFLLDLNGRCVSVDLHYPGRILKFIQGFKNVDRAALYYYRIFGAPILLNTKIEGHGHSENLRKLRELMENPEEMFTKYINYETLLSDSSEK